MNEIKCKLGSWHKAWHTVSPSMSSIIIIITRVDKAAILFSISCTSPQGGFHEHALLQMRKAEAQQGTSASFFGLDVFLEISFLS